MRRTFYAVTALMAAWGTMILLNVGGMLSVVMPELLVIALLETFGVMSFVCAVTAIRGEG